MNRLLASIRLFAGAFLLAACGQAGMSPTPTSLPVPTSTMTQTPLPLPSTETPIPTTEASPVVEPTRGPIDDRVVIPEEIKGDQVIYSEMLGGVIPFAVINDNVEHLGRFRARTDGALLGTPEGREAFFAPFVQAAGYRTLSQLIEVAQRGELKPIHLDEFWTQGPVDLDLTKGIYIRAVTDPNVRENFLSPNLDAAAESSNGWITQGGTYPNSNRYVTHEKAEILADGSGPLVLSFAFDNLEPLGQGFRGDGSEYLPEVMEIWTMDLIYDFKTVVDNKGKIPNDLRGAGNAVINGKDYFDWLLDPNIPLDFVVEQP